MLFCACASAPTLVSEALAFFDAARWLLLATTLFLLVALVAEYSLIRTRCGRACRGACPLCACCCAEPEPVPLHLSGGKRRRLEMELTGITRRAL